MNRTHKNPANNPIKGRYEVELHYIYITFISQKINTHGAHATHNKYQVYELCSEGDCGHQHVS